MNRFVYRLKTPLLVTPFFGVIGRGWGWVPKAVGGSRQGCVRRVPLKSTIQTLLHSVNTPDPFAERSSIFPLLPEGQGQARGDILSSDIKSLR